MKINPELLLEFCKSERQTEVVNAIIASGTVIKAAKLLGINRRSVYRTLNKLEERAASKGVAPHRDLVHQTAEGFDVKRISTAYKGDEPVLQWTFVRPNLSPSTPHKIPPSSRPNIWVFKMGIPTSLRSAIPRSVNDGMRMILISNKS